MTKPTTPKVTTGTTLPEDWRDSHVHTQHFTPNPVERNRPGKAATPDIGPRHEAVVLARRAFHEIADVLRALDDTIAAYEFTHGADGYPVHTEAEQHGDCPECGLIRPCPNHDIRLDWTPTERAMALRTHGARQLAEITRRAAHTAKSAGDLASYVETIRRAMAMAPLSDTERKGLLCQQCDEVALVDPGTGRSLIFALAGGGNQQLCARHRDEALVCDLCGTRPAETSDSEQKGCANKRPLVRTVDGSQAKVCSSCRKNLRGAA